MRLSLCLLALASAVTASLIPGLDEVLNLGFTDHSKKIPKGFVSTKGREFVLDGKAFAFVGANSYWLPLLTNQKDIDATFHDMKQAGVKVLRTWGFNAINRTELAAAKESGLTYYQVWDENGWHLNEGPQGLQRLDNIVRTAEKYDIRIILAFTNNWVGYGGSELYLNWLAGAGQPHDAFYTNRKIVASYQKYAKAIVNRYKSSSTIFAWELMNEARCLGDLPASSNCVAGTNVIPTWYKEQSEFVRNLDPFHMITTGGEGHFFLKTGELASDYNFNGAAGEDFDSDLALPNIDFGTYHMYVQFWYPDLLQPGSNFSMQDWGLDWIQRHVDSANKLNKPVVMEEFGLMGLENKTAIYPSWMGRLLDTKHGGIMAWQWGQLDMTESGGNRLIKYADAIIDGASPNDEFTYYPNQTAVWDIFTHAAKVQNARRL